MMLNFVYRQVEVLTHASADGAYAYCNGQWFFYPWPTEAVKANLRITWIDIFPAVVAARLWGAQWSKHHVIFGIQDTFSIHLYPRGMQWRTRGNTDFFHSPEKNYLLTHLKFAADRHYFTPHLDYVKQNPEFFEKITNDERFRKFLGSQAGVKVGNYSERVPYSLVEDLLDAVKDPSNIKKDSR